MKFIILSLFICFSLQAKDFSELKEKVCKELENSWCSRKKSEFIMDTIYQLKPEKCVEVGVFTGSTLLPIAATLKFLKKGEVLAIDAWTVQDATWSMPLNDPNTQWWSWIDMDEIKNTFFTLYDKWKLSDVCKVIQAPSQTAINDISEIDFLHLDGNFSEEGAYEDVRLYLPKVKSGGHILVSNVFFVLDGRMSKLKALGALLDEGEIVADIEESNTLLIRKK